MYLSNGDGYTTECYDDWCTWSTYGDANSYYSWRTGKNMTGDESSELPDKVYTRFSDDGDDTPGYMVTADGAAETTGPVGFC